MEYRDRIAKVAVLGAAGKMGSGIAALLSQEMVRIKLLEKRTDLKLTLIDTNENGFPGLVEYLKNQARKAAEKQVVQLRKLYAERTDLVDNREIIDQYIDDLIAMIRVDSQPIAAGDSRLVFEAIVENLSVKTAVLSTLADVCSDKTWFLTNTSSLPISLIADRCKLNGRLLGYHFYNPPIVQKLLELIVPKDIDPALIAFGIELADNLKKKVIRSNDVAGFIGNGHFTRDGLFGLSLVDRLVKDFSPAEAIYLVNTLTEDFLVRPMGIFQLIDYVGLDVYQSILAIIKEHGREPDFHSTLIDSMLAHQVKGGQNPDGSQKPGFFTYQKGMIDKLYDPTANAYQAVDERLKNKVAAYLGQRPIPEVTWKAISKDRQADKRLSEYFAALKKTETNGAHLAIEYLNNSKTIANLLVAKGVTDATENVSSVLTSGFYHLYGVDHYV